MSTLLSIKSSRLPKSDLPKKKSISNRGRDFYQKMEIYKKFKDAAEKLKEREVLYRFGAVPKLRTTTSERWSRTLTCKLLIVSKPLNDTFG